jgi:hypothetical protein
MHGYNVHEPLYENYENHGSIAVVHVAEWLEWW